MLPPLPLRSPAPDGGWALRKSLKTVGTALAAATLRVRLGSARASAYAVSRPTLRDTLLPRKGSCKPIAKRTGRRFGTGERRPSSGLTRLYWFYFIFAYVSYTACSDAVGCGG